MDQPPRYQPIAVTTPIISGHGVETKSMFAQRIG